MPRGGSRGSYFGPEMCLQLRFKTFLHAILLRCGPVDATADWPGLGGVVRNSPTPPESPLLREPRAPGLPRISQLLSMRFVDNLALVSACGEACACWNMSLQSPISNVVNPTLLYSPPFCALCREKLFLPPLNVKLLERARRETSTYSPALTASRPRHWH